MLSDGRIYPTGHNLPHLESHVSWIFSIGRGTIMHGSCRNERVIRVKSVSFTDHHCRGLAVAVWKYENCSVSDQLSVLPPTRFHCVPMANP